MKAERLPGSSLGQPPSPSAFKVIDSATRRLRAGHPPDSEMEQGETEKQRLRLPVGLLVNFHVPVLRDGLRRLVNPTLSPSDSPFLPVRPSDPTTGVFGIGPMNTLKGLPLPGFPCQRFALFVIDSPCIPP